MIDTVVSYDFTYLQFSSVAQLCPTLCDPMDCRMPGFPLHYQLPELVQTHVHWVGDAIQPSHPLLSPFPPAFNLSQHQGLFQWVGSLHQVAKVLEIQLPHQFFQWIFSVDFLKDWLVWSPCCPKDSQESSPEPEFQSINSLVFSFLYDPTLTSIHVYWKTIVWTIWAFVGKAMSLVKVADEHFKCSVWVLMTDVLLERWRTLSWNLARNGTLQ